ncbi:MAG: TatD family hydrolase, partial [Spirochaetales bacterium]|nr:TatD family hydrolase [Spirochaetales bacterium]
MTAIPDAHTHIDYVSRLNPDAHAVVNSVIEDDWLKVAQLCHDQPLLHPALGIHPWFAAAQLCHETEWLSRLDNLLCTVPNVSVGEIGLDRAAKANIDIQTEIFEMQLQLAKQHNCAVSIHCFKAFDILIPIIRRYPLTYILHG